MVGWFESLLSGETWLGRLVDQVFTFIAAFVEHDYDAVLVFDEVREMAADARLAPVTAEIINHMPPTGSG